MKSFKVQPFDKRVYVTRFPYEAVCRYNLYAGVDGIEEDYLVGVDGMAFHAVRDRAPHALFMLFFDPFHLPETLLAHECLHMTHFLMEYTDMPINAESTELQAYTLEYLMTNVRRKLDE